MRTAVLARVPTLISGLELEQELGLELELELEQESAPLPLAVAALQRPAVAQKQPPSVAAHPMLASEQRLELLGVALEPELGLAQKQLVSASARAPSRRPPLF